MHYYMWLLFENCALPDTEKKWEVYTDESCTYQHYNRNNNSIWDLNNKQDVMMEKAKHKSSPYCFGAVIQVLIFKHWIWTRWAI